MSVCVRLKHLRTDLQHQSLNLLNSVGRDPDLGMRSTAQCTLPRRSVLKLGHELTGDGPRVCREVSGHITYKSPGHIHKALFSQSDGFSLWGQCEIQKHILCTHIYTGTNALVRKMRAWTKLQWELEGSLAVDSQPVWQLSRTSGPFGGW